MPPILGQPHAIATLSAAMRSGRLHHAWIFSGPRGVGKATTARVFAALLMDPAHRDEHLERFEPEAESEIVRAVEAETHPDLHMIRKELALFSDNAQLRSRKLTNIPLDLLREHMLGGKTSDDRQHEAAAYRTAVRGHGKVFIIDEAELLDPTAQNAMLKTLEEPPLETYIILVTSRPDRLLPTVRSRCHHVRFGMLDEAAMSQWMDAAHGSLDSAVREWVIRFSDGAPGIAELAIEYGFASWNLRLRPMLDEAEQGRYPDELGKMLGGLVEEYAEAWVKAHDNASKDAANKDGCSHLLAMLSAHARAKLSQCAQDGTDPTIWLDAIECISETERQLTSNVNMKHVLENLAAQWTMAMRGTPTVSTM